MMANDGSSYSHEIKVIARLRELSPSDRRRNSRNLRRLLHGNPLWYAYKSDLDRERDMMESDSL